MNIGIHRQKPGKAKLFYIFLCGLSPMPMLLLDKLLSDAGIMPKDAKVINA